MTTDHADYTDFIRHMIADDLESGVDDGRVVTRFPPEPNGYLHIGHAKSICLNFGIAEEIPGARCNLRFDDTNPTKEDEEYTEAIQKDVRWLGFDWGERVYYASDYFDRLHEMAVLLIKEGKAYVDSLSQDEIREYRGTLTEPGIDSPHRTRSVEENLDLFHRMSKGEFSEGAHVLRAKIDMSSPNLNMRDPVLYRILKVPHERSGDKWVVYPMYDYAHPVSDALEHVTHSLCTLEFEDHRPLYDWVVENLPLPSRPRQTEFARLNLSYTVMSKRRLLELVEGGYVSGWDDPRMPTIAGLRRRGYTPEAIRDFCRKVGVARRDNVIDIALLEHSVREDLNARASRRMAVLRPLKLVIENYPEGQVEELEAINNPEDPNAGVRKVLFSKTVYIERDDFMMDPPKNFYRFAPGREVRLQHAYLVTCTGVVTDPATGEPTELRGAYDPESRGGSSPDGRKVRGTSHWVSAEHSLEAEVRLYDRLFMEADPGRDGRDFREDLNPASVEVLSGCRLEASLGEAHHGDRFQFLRQGYFCMDPDSAPGKPVFSRTVALRDSWARSQDRGA